MIQKLVVLKAFQVFVRGDVIADPAKISQILASDHKRFVRPVGQPASKKG